MKKTVRFLPVAEALKQARADLRLENLTEPEWGRHVFEQIASGRLSLPEAQREIDRLVRQRIAAQ